MVSLLSAFTLFLVALVALQHSAHAATQQPTFRLTNVPRSASGHVLVKRTKNGGGKALATYGHERTAEHTVHKLLPGENLNATLARLKSQKDVEWAVEDQVLVLQSTPNDPSFTDQWGTMRVGASAAWDISTGSSMSNVANGTKPVTVCVIDSGIDTAHPDLAANLHPDVGMNAWEATPLTDSTGHGTHVAGTIAAVGNNNVGIAGLAWGGAMKLLACNFIGPQGYGLTSKAVVCIDYCISKGAQIIMASWTSGTSPNQPLQDAFTAAGAAGALIVVAAGNQGQDLSTSPTYPAAYSATMPWVLTVGASDQQDSWPDFSNYGSLVHLSAPGVNILSTSPGGGTAAWTGTSMAAPFGAGAAALALAASGGQLTAAQLRDLLISTAQPSSGLAGRTASGCLLRIDRALQQLASQLGGTPFVSGQAGQVSPPPTQPSTPLSPTPVSTPVPTSVPPATPTPTPMPRPGRRAAADQPGRSPLQLKQVPGGTSTSTAASRKVPATKMLPCKKRSAGCGLRCTAKKVGKKMVRKCTYMKAAKPATPRNMARKVPRRALAQ